VTAPGLQTLLDEGAATGVFPCATAVVLHRGRRVFEGSAGGAALDTVFLASPTSPPDRLAKVAEASRGFVYAVSRTGVTGERQSLSADAKPLVARLRALSGVPVALGFGLSTPEQVREAAAVADGVVVGSALVRFLEEDPQGDLGAQVRWLTSTT